MVKSPAKWMYVASVLCFGTPMRSPKVTKPAIHPFYVSVTEIKHNAPDKILEISCKIFTDDFERTLEKAFHTKVDLTILKDNSETEKFIAEYIPAHLQIRADGKLTVLQYVGSEKEAEATWSYFQVSSIPAIRQIDVVNTLLYEMFDAQINIMHVTVGGLRQSTKVSNPESNAKFVF
jgi:hypothetical protein